MESVIWKGNQKPGHHNRNIFFINKHEIPKECQGDVTYGRIVFVYRDGKKDKYRTRITMGGNLINYPGDCGTPTADLLTVKLLFNSIISMPNAKFMSIDIKNLEGPMKHQRKDPPKHQPREDPRPRREVRGHESHAPKSVVGRRRGAETSHNLQA